MKLRTPRCVYHARHALSDLQPHPASFDPSSTYRSSSSHGALQHRLAASAPGHLPPPWTISLLDI